MLENLNNEIITMEQYQELEENENVKNIECLGQSGQYSNCYWYDVQFTDGSNINIYLEK